MGWFDFLWKSSPSEVPDIQHSILGRLTYQDEGWWEGLTIIDEKEIEFLINGDESGIFADLDRICINVIDHFSEFDQKAKTFLKKTVEDYNIPFPLVFTPFEILWLWKKNNSEGFTIRYNDDHDPYKLWRVEFKDGEPIACGYDD